jgi:RNA polymerase sigma-70 factor, ECF subfamily
MADDTLIWDNRPGYHDIEPRVEAFIRAVYDKHGAYLRRVATGLLYGDSHQAQDFVQETVLRAWRHADTLDPQADGIRSWLVHVLRNLVINGHRTQRSRPPETTDDELAELQEPEYTESVHTRKIVREALSDLSHQHREVLMYVQFLDQSVAQASRALGIPPGTVKSRTHLALKALRAALAERGHAKQLQTVHQPPGRDLVADHQHRLGCEITAYTMGHRAADRGTDMGTSVPSHRAADDRACRCQAPEAGQRLIAPEGECDEADHGNH